MKQKLLIGIALLLLHGLAAQPRGVIKPVPGGQPKKGKFHALVVGVSNYENIHDLRFAHRDAGLMADFLKEQIPLLGYQEYHLSTLLNEQATRAGIYRELNALRDPQRCLPGDRVLLYFSGHGDVEAYTGAQYGYFLPYDCPIDNYMGGAIDLEHLKRLILHLIQREVEVVLIMDACRSGELVENYLEPRSVSAILYTLQLDKVVSLLSCRPEELSLEGAQWGGGQGLFSYVLLTGLKGAADADADQQITVREIERYLEDRVPEMARPGEQTPLTVAMDKRLPLAKIVPREATPPIAAAEAAQPAGTKNPDTAGGARKNELPLYAAYRAALRRGALVRPDSANAFFYYRQLSLEAAFRDSLSAFRRDLVTAMLAETQPFLNRLYVANPESFPPEAFAPHIQALEALLELIDPEDLLYRHLRSDYQFLQGAALSALADDSDEPSLFVAARNAFDQALDINPLAPHAYLWRAYADINLADWEEALSSLGNSLRTNPNYSLPYHLLDQLQARQMEAALTAEQDRSKKRRSRKQEKKMKAEAEELLMTFLPEDLLDRERLEAKAEEAVAIISDDYLSPDKFKAIAQAPAAMETILVMAPAVEERILNVLGEIAVAANPLLESIGAGADGLLAMEEERKRRAQEARQKTEAERQRREAEARQKTEAERQRREAEANQLKKQGDPGGDPNAGNLEAIAGGAARVGGDLTDRNTLLAPKPDDTFHQTGDVVIEICVDIDGNVIRAAYTQRGSTSANADLIEIALTNAKKWKFSKGNVERQCGTISYEFRLR